MRVQTFVGKAGVEALRQMDEHINAWLEDNHVEPKFVKQCFGYGRHHDVSSDEPVVLVSVWY
ncbi:MAG TPA: hypothetical protein HPP77_08690 [Candidatus Hydrogenedentes bacterium]|nr:hypothetical protein [Candidatus Hydrogenedentota bacterium]HIJ73980.1 hypothetical protein [Candidatus Hydrogenedentota bacterium]